MYRVTHKETGHDYVGISIHPRKRWKEHEYEVRRHSKTPFHRALAKYGPDAFEWKIVSWASSTAGAKVLEQLAIHLGLGHYNATKGGDGSEGWRHTPETLAKIRESNRRRGCSAETRARMSAALKASAARRVWVFTPEHRQKISEAKKGHVVSEATRAKLRQSRLGVPKAPAWA